VEQMTVKVCAWTLSKAEKNMLQRSHILVHNTW
jgi:hypothetical protein